MKGPSHVRRTHDPTGAAARRTAVTLTDGAGLTRRRCRQPPSPRRPWRPRAAPPHQAPTGRDGSAATTATPSCPTAPRRTGPRPGGARRGRSSASPQIGDSRPAPAAADESSRRRSRRRRSTTATAATAPRRRRRGGRGRGGGGRGAGGGGGGQRRRPRPASSPDRVRCPTTAPSTSTTTSSSGGGAGSARAVRSAATSCASTSAAAAASPPRSPCSRAARSSSTTCRRPSDDVSQIHGNVYLGKVQNVLPGMEAAFVDIGTPKNAVLYRGDVQYDPEDVEGGGGKRRRRGPKIEQMLKARQTILCQVTKNPIAHKGARLTQEVSLPGPVRRAHPEQLHLRHLQAPARRRAQAAARRPRPGQAGPARRHRAHRGRGRHHRGARARRAPASCASGSRSTPWPSSSQAPALLYREPDMAVRIIREEFNAEFRGVVIDDPALFEEVRDYVASISPALADRVELLRPRRSSRSRCSSASTSTSSCTRPSTARCGCRRAARSSSSTPRPSPSSTSTPARTSGRRASRRRSSATTSRRPTRSPASSGCATSAASSSSTSSTWRSAGNRDAGHQAVPRRPGPGQDPHPGVRHLRARPGRDDPQAHRRGAARVLRRHRARTARAAASLDARLLGVAHLGAWGLGATTGRLVDPMYAVIRTGGKQDASRPRATRSTSSSSASTKAPTSRSSRCSSSTATPVLAGSALERRLASPGRVVGTAKGPKINGFTYKSKTNVPAPLRPSPALRPRRDHRHHEGLGQTTCRRPRAPAPPRTGATPPPSASA